MLTDGAPLLPRSVIMDVHRRKRRDELEAAKKSAFGAASGRFSSKRMSTDSAFKSSAWSTKTAVLPLWLGKLDHLLGTAARELFSEYIYQQPTILLVWIFIALIFIHFFIYLSDIVQEDHNEEIAAAAIVGWLFLVSGELSLRFSIYFTFLRDTLER